MYSITIQKTDCQVKNIVIRKKNLKDRNKSIELLYEEKDARAD